MQNSRLGEFDQVDEPAAAIRGRQNLILFDGRGGLRGRSIRLSKAVRESASGNQREKETDRTESKTYQKAWIKKRRLGVVIFFHETVSVLRPRDRYSLIAFRLCPLGQTRGFVI